MSVVKKESTIEPSAGYSSVFQRRYRLTSIV